MYLMMAQLSFKDQFVSFHLLRFLMPFMSIDDLTTHVFHTKVTTTTMTRVSVPGAMSTQAISLPQQPSPIPIVPSAIARHPLPVPLPQVPLDLRSVVHIQLHELIIYQIYDRSSFSVR